MPPKKAIIPAINQEIAAYLQEQADKCQKEKLAFTYKKAIKGVQNYALPIYSGNQAKQIPGIGDYIASRIQSFLLKNGTADENALQPAQPSSPSAGDEPAPAGRKRKPSATSTIESSPPKKAPRKKAAEKKSAAEKEYVPKPRTGPYAVLIALIKARQGDNPRLWLNKTELCDRAAPYSDTDFRVNISQSYYSAWSGVNKYLVGNGLITANGAPKRFQLTAKGEALAERLESEMKDLAKVNEPSPYDRNKDYSRRVIDEVGNTQSPGVSSPVRTQSLFQEESPQSPRDRIARNNTIRQLLQRQASLTKEPSLKAGSMETPIEIDDGNNDDNLSFGSQEGHGLVGTSKMGGLGASNEVESLQCSASVMKLTSGAVLNADNVGLVDSPRSSAREDSCAGSQSSQMRLRRTPSVLSDASNENNDPSMKELCLRNLMEWDGDLKMKDLKNGKLSVLLDTRETLYMKDRKGMFDLLVKSGLNAEQRSLNVGDITWVIRNGGEEYMAGAVIERKVVTDLQSSIRDGRQSEQSSRLAMCGLKTKIYVVEGSFDNMPLKDLEAIKTSLAKMRIHGFLVHRTPNLEETIRYVNYMTKRLEMGFTSGEMDEAPAVTFAHFNTITSKKEKYNVRFIFGMMLKSIDGVTGATANAIIDKYSTPASLIDAYRRLPEEERPLMFQDWTRGATSMTKVGPAISRKIYQSFFEGSQD